MWRAGALLDKRWFFFKKSLCPAPFFFPIYIGHSTIKTPLTNGKRLLLSQRYSHPAPPCLLQHRTAQIHRFGAQKILPLTKRKKIKYDVLLPLSIGAAHLKMATTATTTTKVEVAYTDRAKHFTREWRKSPGSGFTKLGESLSDSGSITLVQNAEVKDLTCWEKTTLACGCYLNYICWCSPYCCLCNLFRYQTTGDVCPYPVSSLSCVTFNHQ